VGGGGRKGVVSEREGRVGGGGWWKGRRVEMDWLLDPNLRKPQPWIIQIHEGHPKPQVC
jgi:hypothetical protein